MLDEIDLGHHARDPISGTGNNGSAVPFPFLRLPVEIRLAIYSELLALDDNPVDYFTYCHCSCCKAYYKINGTSNRGSGEAFCVNILRTCKLVYGEALPILYSKAFLRLPFDIRCMIYSKLLVRRCSWGDNSGACHRSCCVIEYFCVCHCYHCHQDRRPNRWKTKHPIHPVILRTCRLVLEEALPILHHKASFELDLETLTNEMAQDCSTNSLKYKHDTHLPCTAVRDRIEHVNLGYEYVGGDPNSGYRYSMENFRRWWKPAVHELSTRYPMLKDVSLCFIMEVDEAYLELLLGFGMDKFSAWERQSAKRPGRSCESAAMIQAVVYDDSNGINEDQREGLKDFGEKAVQIVLDCEEEYPNFTLRSCERGISYQK